MRRFVVMGSAVGHSPAFDDIMYITVVICTWNRSRMLDQTLQEMRQLQIANGIEWELIVVNNNSSDDTDGVIAKHESALPVRRLFEKMPGKSFAANAAMEAARGEL